MARATYEILWHTRLVPKRSNLTPQLTDRPHSSPSPPFSLSSFPVFPAAESPQPSAHSLTDSPSSLSISPPAQLRRAPTAETTETGFPSASGRPQLASISPFPQLTPGQLTQATRSSFCTAATTAPACHFQNSVQTSFTARVRDIPSQIQTAHLVLPIVPRRTSFPYRLKTSLLITACCISHSDLQWQFSYIVVLRNLPFSTGILPCLDDCIHHPDLFSTSCSQTSKNKS
ncbi:hypothetical protein CRG98_026040 [Punica granatum]|uniref:Uncharacterized protein n=1 Tax=Punica granatum TaxID=22663 RepID=A0A2I0JCD4_PUNGR|nr:hypothetical protein CRG98_026040 [Punica granatum]